MKNTLKQDTQDISGALEIESGLTDWEVEFVELLGRWVLDDKRELTQNQRKSLDIIPVKADK